MPSSDTVADRYYYMVPVRLVALVAALQPLRCSSLPLGWSINGLQGNLGKVKSGDPGETVTRCRAKDSFPPQTQKVNETEVNTAARLQRMPPMLALPPPRNRFTLYGNGDVRCSLRCVLAWTPPLLHMVSSLVPEDVTQNERQKIH